MPNFYKQLRAENSQSALALQFLILTATRTSETIVASWKEVNLKENLWVVPADRIKGGKEHRITSRTRIIFDEDINKNVEFAGVFPNFSDVKVDRFRLEGYLMMALRDSTYWSHPVLRLSPEGLYTAKVRSFPVGVGRNMNGCPVTFRSAEATR
ncbi:MAG: hypothetical protein OJJ21_13290 [Ferrovibrio sp.]|uniref:hypothetical protein n=1 Tax=Ferrovibrio sp. TaxID=1917215 RepID=UPI0026155B15|nr:hypothetical protein [Ferrovibrio sp.]MCW0234569.1 hypothetical protein [Ferrovibrio sp.]